MQSVLIGKTHLEECPRCEGVWADADSLQQICADQEQQAAVLGQATSQSAPPVNIEEHIHYIPCPVCKNLMNRVNFAHCSQVIVNVCRQHGTWFDKDELHRIVEFIRAGGLQQARAREIQELEDSQRAARAAATAEIWRSGDPPLPWNDNTCRHLGISAVASVIRDFLG
jgi:Zn-finger nucleic acid-binding protein